MDEPQEPLDLETGEALFRELLDGTFEGVLLHDAERVLYANAAAGRIIGAAPEKVVGMDMLRLHPEGRPPEATASSASYGPIEFGVPWLSDPPVIIEAQGRSVRYHGRWVWLTAFRDVSRHKAVAAELEKRIELEEQRVEERTRELTAKQAQLMQAEKMAVLGQLVAGVAHEINTPLGAIKSNTDTLMRSLDKLAALGDDPSEQAAARRLKFLDTGRQVNAVNVQAIERIVAIVNTLRQFARLDQAEVGTVDLHEAIDNTLTLVQHQLKHRVEVKKLYGDLPPVECLPDQLNQVFMNLLVNAGQSIDGKGTITITTWIEGQTVGIEFRDSGKGIPREQLGRIFDPGFTTKGVGVGTGLGLSIVQRIVDEHHGRIEVESEPGRGTAFRLFVPVRRPRETL
jgi:two-component system NtrC family sensor kinase